MVIVEKYAKNKDKVIDEAFANAKEFGKLKYEKDMIFFKKGISWKYIDLAAVKRIYRRVEGTSAMMCCGTLNLDMEKLVLCDDKGEELELYIGDNIKEEAKALFEQIKENHPEIAYGKPEK